jgi:pyruvate formate lyase activating enzyme
MKQAYLYHHLDKNKVKCDLCRHGCTIAPDQKGLCGVRQNQDGELYSLNYAKAIAANIDPVEKKPLYHFLPGSKIFSIGAAGCNFRCDFCQNWRTSQITKGQDGHVVGQNLPPEEVVQTAQYYDCPGIAYTYTEPTIFFEYAKDTAQLAQKEGLKNIFVSNGYETRQTVDQMAGLIDAANIDLKAFNDNYYQEICGAKLDPVLDTIQYMYEKEIWVELTTLIVPGENDDSDELQQLAEFIADVDPDIPWHISRFTPQYKMDDIEKTPRETLRKAAKIGEKAGLNYIYVGNVAWDEYRHTFCPDCGHKLIDRSNYAGTSNIKEDKCPQCEAKIAGFFQVQT